MNTSTQQQNPVLQAIEAGFSISCEEAERAVLGAVLFQPELYYVAAKRLTTDTFFYLQNGIVWQAFQRLIERADPIDYVSLVQELKAMKQFDALGGELFVANLTAGDFRIGNLEYYTKVVAEGAIRRDMMKTADMIKMLASNAALRMDEITEKAQAALRTALSPAARKQVTTIEDATMRHWDKVEQFMQHGAGRAIPTGITSLDAGLGGGLRRKRVYRLGMRMHNGKTATTLSAALNIAKAGFSILLAAVEGTADMVLDTMLAMETGIPAQCISLGRITPEQYSRYVEACGRVSRLPIFIDDSDHQTPGLLRSRGEALKITDGLDVIMVDYDQAMEGGPKMTPYERNTYIAKSCEITAHALDVAYWAASQVNRSAVKDKSDKRPKPHEIEGSGAYEQKSDVIIMGHFERFYDAQTEFPNRLELAVEKNKVTGWRGTVFTRLDPVTTRVTDESEHHIAIGDL